MRKTYIVGVITPAIVYENLGLSQERISRGTLKDMTDNEFSCLSIIVVI